MARYYFSQADSRWANYPYTSPTHPNATVKSSGCRTYKWSNGNF